MNVCDILGMHEEDGACYWITDAEYNIADGAAKCGENGGTPARVIKQSHQEFLADLISVLYPHVDDVYIGVTKTGVNVFTGWLGNTLQHTNWNDHEPIVITNSQVCVVAEKAYQFKWHTAPCSTSYYVACSCSMNTTSPYACTEQSSPNTYSSPVVSVGANCTATSTESSCTATITESSCTATSTESSCTATTTTMSTLTVISTFVSCTVTSTDLGCTATTKTKSSYLTSAYASNAIEIGQSDTFHDLLSESFNIGFVSASSIMSDSSIYNDISIDSSLDNSLAVGNSPPMAPNDLQKKIESLTKAIEVDRRQTSNFLRKFYSASDPRTSSAVIGAFGVIFFSLITIVIIGLDVPILILNLKTTFNRLRDVVNRNESIQNNNDNRPEMSNASEKHVKDSHIYV
ncbi:Hypothetical predicted protein [Mytilus galloprovincialis]|uniref:C-type lectin domain-containing protein n=1 Tax=Mytilus galloprovincialis TaxID=29158 RepID=A0A8B6GC71_MYTGA|nr:Hypothetical predicted protein [Mytilus galloprovincialis]